MMTRISRDLSSHHAQTSHRLRSLGSRRMMSSKAPRVAIVGAGFSGLRCADVLLHSGIHVTVFEARDRVGGRVVQHDTGKHSFDMGPNWIHGTEGNPIMKLVRKTGTVIVEPEENHLIYDSEGQMKSKQESLDLSSNTWATVVDAFKHSDEHHANIDPQTSLLDFFKAKLAKQFPKDESQFREHLKEARMWGPFIGDPVDRQSLRNFFLEECLEGENVIAASTYVDILSEVAKKAQADADLRLNEEVVKIEYRDTANSTDPVTITTVPGGKSAFDEVVVTCPLGWLKRQGDAFSPALPPRLLAAIDNISYGHLEKIYVTFPSAWWLHEPTTTSTSASKGTSDGLNTTEHKAPFFFHFHHPTYHPDPTSKESEFWNQSVVSLAHFPAETAQPTLLFYLYGPCSIYMTSLIVDHEPGSETYKALLWNFILPFVSRLPGYRATDVACTPVALVATQWTNDRFAGNGSYSNFQIGLFDGAGDIECMRDAGGLSDDGRGIWFAGEHTAPFVALGTTTGAYWSGEAVARRILQRYGVEDVVSGEDDGNVVNGEGLRKKMDGQGGDAANLAGLAI